VTAEWFFSVLLNKLIVMGKEKNKKTSYTFCLISGMLCGIIFGAATGKLAVGIALGFMFATMYYLFFTDSGNKMKSDE
jgi:uncharacterized membrane protein YoaK (UPF0700 family)